MVKTRGQSTKGRKNKIWNNADNLKKKLRKKADNLKKKPMNNADK